MTGIEAHDLEEKQERLRQLNAALVGKIGAKEAMDITYWYAAVKDVGCPNCGMDFTGCHPAMNLYPHFTGACDD